MSDRILVLHEGRVTAEIPRDQATEERVMFAATGSAEAARPAVDRRGRRPPDGRAPVADSRAAVGHAAGSRGGCCRRSRASAS